MSSSSETTQPHKETAQEWYVRNILPIIQAVGTIFKREVPAKDPLSFFKPKEVPFVLTNVIPKESSPATALSAEDIKINDAALAAKKSRQSNP